MDTSTMITRQVLWSTPIRESLLPTCRHVIYLLPGRMYRLLFSPTGEPIQVHRYQKGAQLSEDLFLRLLLEREKELTDTFLSVEVVLGTGKHLLVPAAHYDEEFALGITRNMLDDTALAEEIYTTSIPSEEALILALWPASTRYVLEHYLPQAEKRHVGRYLIEWTDRFPTEEGNCILLLLGMGEATLVARKEGQLVLCNTYPVQSSLEVLYYAQAVKKATGLTDRPLSCYVMGETDVDFFQGESIWAQLEDWQIPSPEILGIELSQPDVPYWLTGFLKE